MPLEKTHIAQKKNKIVTHFPNLKPIPFLMQRMVAKGLILVNDDLIHNYLIDAMQTTDEKGLGYFMVEGNYEMYLLAGCTLIYDKEANEIWISKDSDTTVLNPEYWTKL